MLVCAHVCQSRRGVPLSVCVCTCVFGYMPGSVPLCAHVHVGHEDMCTHVGMGEPGRDVPHPKLQGLCLCGDGPSAACLPWSLWERAEALRWLTQPCRVRPGPSEDSRDLWEPM